MHCPECGDNSTQGLNYCKHCGAALNALESKSNAEPRSRVFTWVLVLLATLVGFGGLTMIFAMGFVLAQNPSVHKDFPVALVIFGSLSFVAVFMLLVFMVLRLAGVSTGAGRKTKSKPKPRRDDTPPLIEAPPVILRSVTEHTTRTFEPRMPESNALD
jgi:hypothetical protein